MLCVVCVYVACGIVPVSRLTTAEATRLGTSASSWEGEEKEEGDEEDKEDKEGDDDEVRNG